MLIPVAAASVQKALEQTVSNPARQRQLVNAAHEFEAQLMKEMLPSASWGGDEEADGGGGVLGQFASESLGRSISARGGLGVAERLIAELSREPAEAAGIAQTPNRTMGRSMSR